MDKKVLFNETLTALVEFAAANNNEITMDDVKIYFKDFIEDESQYQFIYDYLTVNKIKIEGFHPSINSTQEVAFDPKSSDNSDITKSDDQSITESEEELAFIHMYMDEISDILPASEADIAELVSQLLSGNLDVVNRLVECHLSTVAELAQNYKGKGVTFGDLIQEGNIGLMLAISDYFKDCGDFTDYIKEKITNTLEEVISLQVSSDRVGQHLADKLNRLDAVTKDLSEKLGRVPEISELAEAMSITEEEASLLLKTSLDTLSVNEDTQITSESDSNATQNDTPKNDPLEWRVNQK